MEQTFRKRIGERTACAIDVHACDTLERRPGVVVDLSQHGAQIRQVEPFAQGHTIHLDVDGHFTWATVAWTEVDRMGLRFLVPLEGDEGLAGRFAALRRSAGQPRPAGRAVFGRRAA